ncbi:MAG: biotin/lipoate A/B protein ligase family protein [Thermoplasmata archaeon]
MPIVSPTSDPRPVAATVVLEAGPVEYASGDETLLRGDGGRVRVALLKARCVTFGVGVRPESAYLERAAAEGIPTVARRTGGTGLLHEVGDLAWTIVLPRDDPRVGADFHRAYDRLGHGVVRWLAGYGVAARWAPAPGVVPEYCTLGDRGSVLSAGDRILGGAAQHMVRTGLLHHGTISVHVDRAAIDRLFDLGPPSPSDRLAGVWELGLREPGPALARGLAEAIASDLGPR